MLSKIILAASVAMLIATTAADARRAVYGPYPGYSGPRSGGYGYGYGGYRYGGYGYGYGGSYDRNTIGGAGHHVGDTNGGP
jgi:hypothetical protein